MAQFLLAFSGEWMKLRRSRGWITLIVLIVLPVVYGIFINNIITSGQYEPDVENGWYMYIMMTQLFYGSIFYPIIVSVIAGTLISFEKQANNWLLMFTAPVHHHIMYFSKLAWLALLSLLVQLTMMLMIVIGGVIMKISDPIPLGEMALMIVFGTLGAVSLGVLLLYAYLQIKSNRHVLILSILLSFPAFIAFSNEMNSWLPALYPWILPLFGMTTVFFSKANLLIFALICCLLLMVFSFLTIRSLKRPRLG